MDDRTISAFHSIPPTEVDIVRWQKMDTIDFCIFYHCHFQAHNRAYSFPSLCSLQYRRRKRYIVCRELSNYIDSINDTVNALSVKLHRFPLFTLGNAGKSFTLTLTLAVQSFFMTL